MVQFLVRLLDTGLESLENPAATKAQIVKALKAMTTSLKYGEKVGIDITTDIHTDGSAITLFWYYMIFLFLDHRDFREVSSVEGIS